MVNEKEGERDGRIRANCVVHFSFLCVTLLFHIGLCSVSFYLWRPHEPVNCTLEIYGACLIKQWACHSSGSSSSERSMNCTRSRFRFPVRNQIYLLLKSKLNLIAFTAIKYKHTRNIRWIRIPGYRTVGAGDSLIEHISCRRNNKNIQVFFTWYLLMRTNNIYTWFLARVLHLLMANWLDVDNFVGSIATVFWGRISY